MSILYLLIPFFLFSYFFNTISGETKFVAAGHIYCTTTGHGTNKPVDGAKVVLMEADGQFIYTFSNPFQNIFQ